MQRREALGERVHQPLDVGVARDREVVVVSGAPLRYRVESQRRRIAAHQHQLDSDLRLERRVGARRPVRTTRRSRL